jgi:hypothetical protein
VCCVEVGYQCVLCGARLSVCVVWSLVISVCCGGAKLSVCGGDRLRVCCAGSRSKIIMVFCDDTCTV